ncbi:MAG: sugar-binding protein [Armatimonadota bacterium]
MNRTLVCAAALLALGLTWSAAAQEPAKVGGVIPRARNPVVLDGKLDEWRGAFATPVNFGHADWANRAAVWHYLWDDQHLYIGLECLDEALYNESPGPIYNGDGVEFYLDLREPGALGSEPFTPGTLHLFYTAASNGEVKPRIQIRPGIPAFADVTTEGMEAAAAKTPAGYTLELRLPWSKIPGFKPAAGREIGIDCELCSSDGGPRVDRCWVYSGVAAVRTPAAFGRMRLVESWSPAEAAPYADVLFPSFVARSTPLNEPATLFVGISPAMQDAVKSVQATAAGKPLPMTVLKPFGPGWRRAQSCLVGFVGPDDPAAEVRFLGDGGKVLATRTVPLK